MPLQASLLYAIRADAPFEAAVLIVLATFVLEDVTLVAVGMLAADRLISVPLALGALAIGIALGDMGLYGIGRLAITHPMLMRWIDKEKPRRVRSWIEGRLYSTVVAARFIPGARLPTYLACGVFAVPFRRFGTAVIGATAAWSCLLFACAYYFGVATLTVLGIWRWPIVLFALALLYMVGRLHWKRAMRSANG